MKFSEFYIGMPICFTRNTEEVGIITKYCGNVDGVYYVNVDLGEYTLEVALDGLKPAKGNI